jgi:hypothetical protein
VQKKVRRVRRKPARRDILALWLKKFGRGAPARIVKQLSYQTEEKIYSIKTENKQKMKKRSKKPALKKIKIQIQKISSEQESSGDSSPSLQKLAAPSGHPELSPIFRPVRPEDTLSCGTLTNQNDFRNNFRYLSGDLSNFEDCYNEYLRQNSIEGEREKLYRSQQLVPQSKRGNSFMNQSKLSSNDNYPKSNKTP